MKRTVERTAGYICPGDLGIEQISRLRAADDWAMALSTHNLIRSLEARIQGHKGDWDLSMPLPKVVVDLLVAEKVMGWQLYAGDSGRKRWPYFYSTNADKWQGRVIVFAENYGRGQMFSPTSEPNSAQIMEETVKVRGKGRAYKARIQKLGLDLIKGDVRDPKNWTPLVCSGLELRAQAALAVLGY